MRPPQNAGESATSSRATGPPPRGFNEAPAERGGKCGGEHPHGSPALASMRPPQNAGESVFQFSTQDADTLASMRPPQNAGES